MTVFDFYLEFLTDSVEFLDRQLVRLDQEIQASPDPDGLGLFDRYEQVIGLGLVACQQYITATRTTIGAPKEKVFNYGPHHRTGFQIASIINAGANFWKHSKEWDNGTDGARTRKDLLSLVDDLDQPYALTNIFHELLSPLPLRFERVVPFLVNWRDDMIRHYGYGKYVTLDE